MLNRVHDAIKAKGLTETELDGRTLWIHISNQNTGVCTGCRWGLKNDELPEGEKEPDGVLKQFSDKHPLLQIVVTVEGGKNAAPDLQVLQIKGGAMRGYERQ